MRCQLTGLIVAFCLAAALTFPETGYSMIVCQGSVPLKFSLGQACSADLIEATEPPPRGGAEYRQYCGRCHRPEELFDYLAKLPAETGRDDFIGFLSRHGGSSAPVDEMIVDYLLAISP